MEDVPVPPIADPLAFFAWYYITGAGIGDALFILKLAVMSSILALPFALAGKQLYGRVAGSAAVKTVAATVAAVTLFWLLAGVWRAANGLNFFHENFGLSLVLSCIVGLVFAAGGVLAYRKMTQAWKLPSLLAAYASCFASSLIFWVFVWLVIQTGV